MKIEQNYFKPGEDKAMINREHSLPHSGARQSRIKPSAKKLLVIPYWVFDTFTSNGNVACDMLDVEKLRNNLNDTDLAMCGSLNKLQVFEGTETLISIQLNSNAKQLPKYIDAMAEMHKKEVYALLSKPTYYRPADILSMVLDGKNRNRTLGKRVGYDLVPIGEDYIGLIPYDNFFSCTPLGDLLVSTLVTKISDQFSYKDALRILPSRLFRLYMNDLARQ